MLTRWIWRDSISTNQMRGKLRNSMGCNQKQICSSEIEDTRDINRSWSWDAIREDIKISAK
jgi:hypothetical protein